MSDTVKRAIPEKTIEEIRVPTTRPIFSAILFLAVSSVSVVHADERPNILLLMADDLGYSDPGCFGSEIRTPNLDRLAKEGLQFTRFRATPMCVTSRIALMSGMPMHRAGSHDYSASLPLPQLLRRAGYRTLMTGKWHAGQPDPRSRTLFDRSFGFMGGATDSFKGGNDWFLDERPFTSFGKEFFSTQAFADRSIEFMQEAVERKQPFFMYVAFNAPHHPCQAPRETVEPYLKTYADGYQKIRAQRIARMRSRGLIADSFELAPTGAEVRQWDELSPHRQSVETMRMAAYAGAVEEVDKATGRILDYLKSAGIAENTLVLFLSDNGGDYSNGSIDKDALQIPWKPGTNPSSSNGWAAVKCTPFRYYKHSSHEGGIATPLIIRWPLGITRKTGSVVDTPTSITDIYPTLSELARTTIPESVNGKELRSVTGTSLLPLLKENGTRRSQPVFQWYAISRAWIEDEWKAVSLYNGPWQLFNLQNDRGEVNNLAARHPEKLRKMIDRWTAFAEESGIQQVNDPALVPQRNWGWHRLKMPAPQLVSVSPANGTSTAQRQTDLVLNFNDPVSFKDSPNRTIRLYDVSDDRDPIWQFDPDETHSSEGKRRVVLSGLPTLKADHHYAVRWDAGWVKVGKSRIGPLNDGAFWWRFRTGSDQMNGNPKSRESPVE